MARGEYFESRKTKQDEKSLFYKPQISEKNVHIL